MFRLSLRVCGTTDAFQARHETLFPPKTPRLQRNKAQISLAKTSRSKNSRRLTSDPIRISLGLLPSGPDPIGEWLVHRQSPGAYLGPKAPESKRGAPACAALSSGLSNPRKSCAFAVDNGLIRHRDSRPSRSRTPDKRARRRTSQWKTNARALVPAPAAAK